jgi:dihydroorotate dehydrogenase
VYKNIIRSILFVFDPESVHHLSFTFIKLIHKLQGTAWVLNFFYGVADKRLEREVFGLKFKNPVGLAAGFDKDAVLIDQWQSFGFGFVEIGTLTPKPQDGNPKKRLFRLIKDEAIINRMGFNNHGVDAAVLKLKQRNSNLIIGGNIGKNKLTDNEEAAQDYKYCFEALFDYVDYFVVNVSSPNTPNLRDLQEREPLTKLLMLLMDENNKKIAPKPILLKIAPDLTNSQLDDIIAIVQETKIAGLITTNTTVARDNLLTDWKVINEIGSGGLSGGPLKDKSTEVIRYLHQKSGGSFPIIGVGGIGSAADAIEKIEAGATLVQIYTGFVYNGPSLVSRINKAILKKYHA